MTAQGMKYRVEKAKRAIDEVFSDTSVSKDMTREAMGELLEDIEGKLESMGEDEE